MGVWVKWFCISFKQDYRRVHSSINYQMPHYVRSQKGSQIKR
jgi:hypothetical protein